MDFDPNAIKEQFEFLRRLDADFSGKFFELLLERDTELQQLFRYGNTKEQVEFFDKNLEFIVSHIHDPYILVPHLKNLGARQLKFGVRQQLYGLFGAVFLSTLALHFKEKWNSQTEQNWNKMYEWVASTMLQGMSQVEGNQRVA